MAEACRYNGIREDLIATRNNPPESLGLGLKGCPIADSLFAFVWVAAISTENAELIE